MSEETLMHAAPSSLFDMRLYYKQCLDQAGYLYKGGGCRLEELSGDVVVHFGKPYLQWLGFFRDGQDARDWLVPLLCRGQAVPPTVAHILLQQFIASGYRNTRRRSLRVRLQCPCQAPEHLDGEFDGTVAWSGEREGNAKCVCGATFRFHLNGDVAVVDKIWRYAHCYRGNAIQLNHNGRTVQEIATELRVSAMMVRRQLSSCQSATTGGVSCSSEAQTRRKDWLFAVKRAGSIRFARLTARRTYRMLLKHDRGWLMQQRCDETGRRLERVNWTVRDNTYVAALQQAAETLRQEVPPRWVSAISVLMVARVPRGTRNQLEKLPKCRALLMSVVETRAQFRHRRAGIEKFIANVFDRT
jgi:Tn7-like transposition protein D